MSEPVQCCTRVARRYGSLGSERKKASNVCNEWTHAIKRWQ